MKKLMLIMLALMAVLMSVPAAYALDANRDALKQQWRDQVNLEKQQLRIEGLASGPAAVITPDLTKAATPGRAKAPGPR